MGSLAGVLATGCFASGVEAGGCGLVALPGERRFPKAAFGLSPSVFRWYFVFCEVKRAGLEKSKLPALDAELGSIFARVGVVAAAEEVASLPEVEIE